MWELEQGTEEGIRNQGRSCRECFLGRKWRIEEQGRIPQCCLGLLQRAGWVAPGCQANRGVVAESSDLQTNGPLTARKGLVFNWPLSCRGHCEMTLTCRGLSFLPTKQVKSSCQWGGNGRNMALCPACSLGPWPSYWGAWPRSCCRELNSSCLESPLGTGAPLPGPSLKRRHQNLLHPRWHTGALFPGG